ncbi:MAG: hypothetical protein BWY09_02574 [Candidatus Hydrogenedentes bacterium ADurb.Bin179]|nr:MAG: hypothetical protein BWY09_02574 [Candidatus Hydrogenedentes bacterium ADurb.Bin179]
MSPRLFRGVALQVLHQERAGAYQAHIAFQYIEQFRQLIEAGGTEKKAEGCQARRIGKEVAAGIAGISHGAKLEQPEGSPPQTGALLSEQDGDSQFTTYGSRKKKHHRR